MATPMVEPYVVPMTVVILIAVFAIQQHGTHRVGRLFGPVMVVWFVVLAVLGVSWIGRAPAVLGAVNPIHAVRFFAGNGWHGFAVLGAVFLVVTGGEALYADMGHFGKRPIRLAWFALVLPALLLNYFGQGALLLVDAAPESRVAPVMATGPPAVRRLIGPERPSLLSVAALEPVKLMSAVVLVVRPILPAEVLNPPVAALMAAVIVAIVPVVISIE